MIVVTDILSQIVQKTALIYGKPVHFFFGHIFDISAELMERSKTVTYRGLKYPSIMLLQDFSEKYQQGKAWDCEADLQILIVAASDNKFSPENRKENVFRPVLYPIYEAFIKALKRTPAVLSSPETNILNTKTDRPAMSLALNAETRKEGIPALFADHLDGIEVRLSLKLFENC
jgi:hypothetical protein